MTFDYAHLLSDIPALVTGSFLLLTVISLWINKSLWPIFLTITLSAALYAGRITWIALPSILFLTTSVYFTYHAQKPIHRRIATLCTFIIGSLFIWRLIPGFNNWKIVSNFLISQDAVPYSLYINLNSTIVGILILALGIPLINNKNDITNTIRKVMPTTILAIIVLIAAGVLTSFIHFDPKFTNLFFLWTIVNLMFTCIAEEAFFRGFLQQQLGQLFGQSRFGLYFALMLASILFGYRHISGGITYALLATIAGLFYGWAYLRTNRIESSICIHFLVNATHFLLFTYPAVSL